MADKNISNKVFQYIKEKIIDKTWKPGDKITSEIQLAEELEVSRISVREAISKLVAMNVLITKKGGGSFVNSFSTTDYMDELIPFLMVIIHQVEVEVVDIINHLDQVVIVYLPVEIEQLLEMVADLVLQPVV